MSLLTEVTALESTYLTAIHEHASTQEVLYSLNTGPSPLIPEGLVVPWDDTLCKRALETGERITCDVQSKWGDSDAARQLGLTTYVSHPICDVDGKVVGTLCGASVERKEVSLEAQRMLSVCARLIEWQLQRSRLLRELRTQNQAFEASAHQDPLTGVLNRRGLEKELRKALAAFERSGTIFYAVFIDLDGFKQINDTFGHDAGDRFLIHVCHRLDEALREDDVLARVGGDEFVVLLRDQQSTAMQIEDIKKRLYAVLVGDYTIDDFVIPYEGASMGYTKVKQGDSSEALLERADEAMYAEKRARKAKRSASA